MCAPRPRMDVADAPSTVTRFDLHFDLVDEGQGVDGHAGVTGSVEFATDLFDPASVRALVERWILLLDAAVDDPDRSLGLVDVLTAAERDLVLGSGAAAANRRATRRCPTSSRPRWRARRTPWRWSAETSRSRTRNWTPARIGWHGC